MASQTFEIRKILPIDTAQNRRKLEFESVSFPICILCVFVCARAEFSSFSSLLVWVVMPSPAAVGGTAG
jgi:hypothetical protein